MRISASRVKAFLFVLLFLSSFYLPATAAAAETTDGAALLNSFMASGNSVYKRDLVFSLNSTSVQNGESAPQWVSDLLGSALVDENPVVVAAAAYQIGQFKLTGYGTQLVQLYRDAEAKYGSCGYVERVRYSIIPALGKIGNSEAKTLIKELLKSDNGSDLGELLLFAIKDLNDPAFINELNAYTLKMRGLIDNAKQKGYDPIVYSRPLFYIQLATDVKQGLALKGGK